MESTRGWDPRREIESSVRTSTQRRGFQRSFEVAGRANGTRGSAECRPSGWQYPCPVLSPRIILPYLSRTTHSRTLILSSPPFVSATVRPLSLCPVRLQPGENYCILKRKQWNSFVGTFRLNDRRSRPVKIMNHQILVTVMPMDEILSGSVPRSPWDS